jgi:hypothetical protein
MKKLVFVLIMTIGNAFFYFAQDGVILNTRQSLFASNEKGSVVSQTKTHKKSDELIKVLVDTAETSTFEFHCRIFPNDTLFERYPRGYVDTIVLIGCRNIQARKVTISYSGENKLYIQTQDSRIPAVQQAMDSSGNWVSLEYFFHSDCGNSYSSAKITKNECYQFKIGKYEGNYCTKMRLKMLIEEQVIYSNEFYGSINYEQLNSDYNKMESEILFR